MLCFLLRNSVRRQGMPCNSSSPQPFVRTLVLQIASGDMARMVVLSCQLGIMDWRPVRRCPFHICHRNLYAASIHCTAGRHLLAVGFFCASVLNAHSYQYPHALLAPAERIGEATLLDKPGHFATGRWTHKDAEIEGVELILGDTLLWSSGGTSKVTPVDGNRLSLTVNGGKYEARVIGQSLVWDDGDIWIRASGHLLDRYKYVSREDLHPW